MCEHMGLYRGKRIDNGEWVEGNLLYDREQNEAFIAESFEDRAANIREVDPDTVGECTGLRDKNGKLIFEGDIVRCDELFTAVVKWDSSHARFVLAIIYEAEIDDYVNLTRGKADKLAVTGAIHDDPELLKGGEGDADI